MKDFPAITTATSNDTETMYACLSLCYEVLYGENMAMEDR